MFLIRIITITIAILILQQNPLFPLAKNNEKTGKKDIKQEKSDQIKENNSAKKTDTIPKNKKKEPEKNNKVSSKEKKQADWIEKTLNYGTQKDRKDAMNKILLLKNKEIRKKLDTKIIEIIKEDPDSEVKIKAITIAGELELKEAMPALIQTLDGEDIDVKVSAVYAIKKINDPSANEKLEKELLAQDLTKSSNYLEALISTLQHFKVAKISNYVIKSISDEKTAPGIREILILYLGKIDSKESKDFLLKTLKDEDEDLRIRAFAANSISHLNIKEAAPDIDSIIKQIDSYSFKKKKKYYNLYIYCIAALAKLGDIRAFPSLVNALRSDNAMVRLKAINLIKDIKDKRTIDILKYKMKYDPNPKVQEAAKKALDELGIKDEKEKKGKEKAKK